MAKHPLGCFVVFLYFFTIRANSKQSKGCFLVTTKQGGESDDRKINDCGNPEMSKVR